MDALELKLCDIQGRLFELSLAKGYDSEKFVSAFMISDVAKHLDSEYNRLQWAGEEYVLEELIAEKDITQGDTIDREMLYWSGYLYRYWHFYTGESSKEIYKQAPIKTMKVVYLMYHTMSPEMAIDRLKESKGENK